MLWRRSNGSDTRLCSLLQNFGVLDGWGSGPAHRTRLQSPWLHLARRHRLRTVSLLGASGLYERGAAAYVQTVGGRRG